MCKKLVLVVHFFKKNIQINRNAELGQHIVLNEFRDLLKSMHDCKLWCFWWNRTDITVDTCMMFSLIKDWLGQMATFQWYYMTGTHYPIVDRLPPTHTPPLMTIRCHCRHGNCGPSHLIVDRVPISISQTP